MNPKITAIVCTCDRADSLRVTLESLLRQTLHPDQYEVVVVDNASSDHTHKIVNNFLERKQIRYVGEPRKGLSAARNTGWKSALGDYVAYVDDDAEPSPDWLEQILTSFEERKQAFACVGGKVDLVWAVEKPAWLSEETSFCLGRLDFSDQPMLLEKDSQFLHGCNMAFDKGVLKEMNGFDETLGRKGHCLLSCEEILLQRELRRHGYRCGYFPSIYVRHHVPSSRVTKKWILDRMKWEGISTAKVDAHFFSGLLPMRGTVLWETVKLLISLRLLMFLLPTGKSSFLFDQKCIAMRKAHYISQLIKG